MTAAGDPTRPEDSGLRLERAAGEGGTPVAVGQRRPDEPETVEIPEILPVLPLKNTVLYPFLLSPLLVNSVRSKRVIEHVLVTPERLMLAVAVSRELDGSPGPDDVYRVATKGDDLGVR